MGRGEGQLSFRSNEALPVPPRTRFLACLAPWREYFRGTIILDLAELAEDAEGSLKLPLRAQRALREKFYGMKNKVLAKEKLDE